MSGQINQFCLPVMRGRGRLNLVTVIGRARRLPALTSRSGCPTGEMPTAVRQVAFRAKKGQVVVRASSTDASAAHSSISKGPMAPVVMS